MVLVVPNLVKLKTISRHTTEDSVEDIKMTKYIMVLSEFNKYQSITVK